MLHRKKRQCAAQHGGSRNGVKNEMANLRIIKAEAGSTKAENIREVLWQGMLAKSVCCG